MDRRTELENKLVSIFKQWNHIELCSYLCAIRAIRLCLFAINTLNQWEDIDSASCRHIIRHYLDTPCSLDVTPDETLYLTFKMLYSDYATIIENTLDDRRDWFSFESDWPTHYLTDAVFAITELGVLRAQDNSELRKSPSADIAALVLKDRHASCTNDDL